MSILNDGQFIAKLRAGAGCFDGYVQLKSPSALRALDSQALDPQAAF